MAEIMIPARGCVYVPPSTTGGKGFYALRPALEAPRETPILIEGTDTSLQDIVYPVTTLDRKKYLYVMGDDFGNITINGMALLGTKEHNGASFRRVKAYFDAYRVAKTKRPIQVSCPGNVTLQVYLRSIVIARADPQFNIQFFALQGVVAEPKSA